MKIHPASTSTRRKFLTQSAASAFGFTFIPAYLTSARAQDNPKHPPSQRINLGCIGVGGRASGVIPGLCKGGIATPIALCDVDFELPKRIENNLKAYPDAKRFHDFREMFDKMSKDIDAVSVCSPDHTHFTATIQAMSLGKHVYVEKPLTRTFEESEILMRAEKKFGVVTQMGNQGHTGRGFNQFSKMVELGLCNNLTKLDAWKTAGLWFMKEKDRASKLPLSKDTIPSSLKNWDLWCGPRKQLPFNSLYHPFNWRGFHEYGMGMLGDWGAHILDYLHDKLDMGLPTEIKALHMEDHNKTIFPLASQLSMHFPARGENRPAIDMTWKDGAGCHPNIPKHLLSEGQKAPKLGGAGSLLYSDDSPTSITRGSHGSSPFLVSKEDQKKYNAHLKEVPNAKLDHFASFIAACKGEGTTNSPFSIGAELTQVFALGTIAQYLSTDLTFDPKKKQFIRNDTANALLNPPARKEWEGHYKLA
ncbi:Gfo/Idh/MocA family oxidoreductase [Akkermansiaceae bacterium]|nr:Gfo/Idh/MocA family oxidoreductase [Akkermansiaceae bacterium]